MLALGYCGMLQYVGARLLWNPAICWLPVIMELCNMSAPSYCEILQCVGTRLL